MKLAIDRMNLLRPLSHINSVVERRNTIPILSNVLIEAEGNTARFRATDLDIEVVDKAPAQVEQAGTFVQSVGSNCEFKLVISGSGVTKKDINSNDYRRLVFDEIFSNLLYLSKSRKIVKVKKIIKVFDKKKVTDIVLKNFSYKLTNGQLKILGEIEKDIKSNRRMFRLLQGDVGSGKTILSFIAASDVVSSNHQVAFMAPTEILANQHYQLAKKLFKGTNVTLNILTGKTNYKEKNKILSMLENKDINFIFGTHSLFQNKIKFSNLGLIIIDEQHKFGVNLRLKLAKKGGKNCDLLLMSATPIPRTMMLSFFGDMDISRLKEKPKNRH